MKYRTLGKTGFEISEISLGTWQVGGKWGSGFNHAAAENILRKAIDAGINFIDTADVYEAGESEIAVGKILKQYQQRIFVATKCGRQIQPHINAGYTTSVLRKYVEDSLQRLQVERIDLIQLHCPPTEVYYRPEIFGLFEQLQQEGKIAHLGVSVEKVEEALKAIEYENVTTVQIIYNLFRQRPNEYFFERAAAKNVGIIARVPLASGLLTGQYSLETQFAPGDHRQGNRNGEWFDKGETFAGIPYEIGLTAVDALKQIVGSNTSLIAVALQWILNSKEVSCIIPGASSSKQVQGNIAALGEPTFSAEQLQAMNAVYTQYIQPRVHHLW